MLRGLLIFLSLVFFLLASAQMEHPVNLERGFTAKPEKIIKIDADNVVVLSVQDEDKSKLVFLSLIADNAKQAEAKINLPGAKQVDLYQHQDKLYLVYTAWADRQLKSVSITYDSKLREIEKKELYSYLAENENMAGHLTLCRNQYTGATYVYHEKAYQKDKKEEASVVWISADFIEVAVQNYVFPYADKSKKVNVPVAGQTKLFVLKRIFEAGKNDYYLLVLNDNGATPINKSVGYGNTRITDLQYAINEKDEIHVMASVAPASGGVVNSFVAARFNADGIQLENKFFSHDEFENNLFKSTLKKMPFMHVKAVESIVDAEGLGVFTWNVIGFEKRKNDEVLHFKEWYLARPFRSPAVVSYLPQNLIVNPSDLKFANPSLAYDNQSFVLVSSHYISASKSKPAEQSVKVKLDYFEYEKSEQQGAFMLDLQDNSKFYYGCKPVLREGVVYLISTNDRNFYLNAIKILE